MRRTGKKLGTAQDSRKIPSLCLCQRMGHPALTLAAVLLLGLTAVAQNITGTVTNLTTGKPSAGDDVVLLSLMQGMQEVSRTKSDAQGHFTLPPPTEQRAPHMVRVTHGGVNYFPQSGPLMPGATTADIGVYDTAKKVDELEQSVEVDRFQSDGTQLQGIVLYAIKNNSQPPRTLASDTKTFEFVLPEGAELDSSYAKGPGGQPVNSAANPTAQKNHYAFTFPLRPGETQFQVAFHMPYSGEASISPKIVNTVQHYVVMYPKGMRFTAKDPQQFQPMPDDTGAGVMVVTNAKPGQDLSFRIGGTGVFQAEQQSAQAGGAEGGAMGGGGAANDSRPGGGLGAPIDAPDPLHDYRAYILGAFALVLVAGGFYIVSKSNNEPRRMAVAAGGVQLPSADSQKRPASTTPPNRAAQAKIAVVEEAPESGANIVAEATAPAQPSTGRRDHTSMLLEAMKEELFQLEVDRQQGKISPEEYAKTKAALDETLRRAIARNSS